MSVGRICTREVDLATADETVQQAAERMHQRTVGTLVLVDATQQPIGIVTDRDFVVRVLARGKDSQATTVGRAMTAQPETVLEDTPLELCWSGWVGVVSVACRSWTTAAASSA